MGFLRKKQTRQRKQNFSCSSEKRKEPYFLRKDGGEMHDYSYSAKIVALCCEE